MQNRIDAVGQLWPDQGDLTHMLADGADVQGGVAG
jgi:hypothetical protein